MRILKVKSLILEVYRFQFRLFNHEWEEKVESITTLSTRAEAIGTFKMRILKVKCSMLEVYRLLRAYLMQRQSDFVPKTINTALLLCYHFIFVSTLLYKQSTVLYTAIRVVK